MSITTLDPTAALVVIDLQKGIVGARTVHPAGAIVARSAELARAFRARGLPVVLVNVIGAAPGRTQTPRPAVSRPADWAELVPELEASATDVRVSKRRWGAFLGTSLDADLRARGVTQIVLAGIATSIGVESTARSAYDLGYHIVLASDAITDRDADAHRNSMEKIFPKLGEVDDTAAIVARVDRLTA